MACRQAGYKRLASIAAGIVLATASAAGVAQSWKPEKTVEIVVSSAPGGSNDQVARMIQKIAQEQKLFQCRSRCSTSLAGTRLSPAPISTSFREMRIILIIGNPTLIANTITGLQQFTDFTPVVLMINEFTAFTMRPDSPLRNAQDLVAQLRKDPESVSIGVSNRGGTNHLALSMLAKAGGVDVRRLKVVVFKTNAEGLTAILGGHIQVVASAVGTTIGQVRNGKAKIISVSAPQRLGGDLAQVPTLREQGYDVSLSNWRAIIGPKGLSAAQAAYWEEVLSRVVATEEWKATLGELFWDSNFLRGREFGKYMEQEYAQTKVIMTELGLVK